MRKRSAASAAAPQAASVAFRAVSCSSERAAETTSRSATLPLHASVSPSALNSLRAFFSALRSRSFSRLLSAFSPACACFAASSACCLARRASSSACSSLTVPASCGGALFLSAAAALESRPQSKRLMRALR